MDMPSATRAAGHAIGGGWKMYQAGVKAVQLYYPSHGMHCCVS